MVKKTPPIKKEKLQEEEAEEGQNKTLILFLLNGFEQLANLFQLLNDLNKIISCYYSMIFFSNKPNLVQ